MSLILTEMQIKTVTRLSPHTSQNGHRQKSSNNKMLERVRGRGNASTLLVEMEIDVTTMENSTEVPWKHKSWKYRMTQRLLFLSKSLSSLICIASIAPWLFSLPPFLLLKSHISTLLPERSQYNINKLYYVLYLHPSNFSHILNKVRVLFWFTEPYTLLPSWLCLQANYLP